MYPVWTYGIYLAVSVALTVWVAQTLFRNGRIFLVDAVAGNEALADSLNHLLVVGFYLVNIGFVTTALRYGNKPHDLVQVIEFTSAKIGTVLLVLGVMHFVNLYVFSQARKHGLFGIGHSGQEKKTVELSSSLLTSAAQPLEVPGKPQTPIRSEQEPC